MESIDVMLDTPREFVHQAAAFLPRLAGYIADHSMRAAYLVPLCAYLGITAFGFAAARVRPEERAAAGAG